MFEAWSVGVRIRLIDNASIGLLGLSRAFAKGNVEAKLLQTRLDSIKKTMLVSGIMVGAGIGLLAMFKPALDEAKKFEQEVTKFSLYGMGDAVNAEAVKFAKGMNIMGSSYTDSMRLMTESQGIFRESGKLTMAQQLEGARIAAPILAKLAFIQSGLSEDQKGMAHTQDLAMLRFIEARGGANDPRVFASIADWGYKLQQSSGGVVDWSNLQQLVATAGAAGFNLSQDAISKLEPVIADLKGGRTGSGMRVAFQRMLGTQRGLPKQAVSEYLTLGLWDPSKVELSSGGGIKRFLGLPGDVLRDRTKFATDPVAFYTENFLPAIARKYGAQILGDTPQAKVERAAEISMVFGPGTSGALFSQIDKLLPAIQRSLEAQNKQLGIDPSYKKTGDTMAGKQVDLLAKFRNLLIQTGQVALPLVVKALEVLLPMLKGLSSWAQAHPNMFGALIRGLITLGVILIVGGIVTGLSGIIRAFGLLKLVKFGTMITDLAGTGGALTALSLVRFGLIAAGIYLLVTNLPKLLGALGQLPGAFAAEGEARDETRFVANKARETLRRHGLDSNGRPIFVPPAGSGASRPITGNVYLDKAKVGKLIADYQASKANGPSSGLGAFDLRQNFSPTTVPSF